jgi:hypothetical protein
MHLLTGALAYMHGSLLPIRLFGLEEEIFTCLAEKDGN